jgi:hypothetical protein
MREADRSLPQNRFAYTPKAIASFVENAGWYYAGCGDSDSLLEVGEAVLADYLLDWKIQIFPHTALIHEPTGHYWLPWFDACEDVGMLRKVIRAGVELELSGGLA